jgi:hypothetical protein
MCFEMFHFLTQLTHCSSKEESIFVMLFFFLRNAMPEMQNAMAVMMCRLYFL